MKRLTIALGLLLLAACGYLLLWPVAVDPVSWDAPRDRGLVDPFAPNDRLGRLRYLELGSHPGPEAVTGRDGFLYTGTADGNILRLRGDGSGLTVFARPGGRPLGLELDAEGNLIVANMHLGLQRIAADGSVSLLLEEWRPGERIYPNDVAVAADGRIFFTESSAKFSGPRYGGTYDASLLDIVEHGGQGRLFEYDPARGETRVLVSGLDFANGVAISDDQSYLLVAETGHYRIWRVGHGTPVERRVILDNLPGFPDNIDNGLAGRYRVGLVAPRNALIDELSDRPWLRRLILRLPRAMRPQAEPSTHVIGIDGNGLVLMNLQDSRAAFPSVTGVFETADALYLSSLSGSRLARLDKQSRARP
ncbi:MAG: SMP-30/gluconolactonase/LRE family protein [Woeseiaceae bacterium]